MTSCGDLRILFRARGRPAARLGHLVRCRSLARALGVRPLIALRGGPRVVETAVALGCDVITRQRVERAALSCARRGRSWTTRSRPTRADGCGARRAGCLVVSIHDLGLGCLDADLVIDGSITRNARARQRPDAWRVRNMRSSIRRHSMIVRPPTWRPRSGGPQRRRARSLRGARCARRRSARRAGATISPKRSSRRIRRPGFASPVASRASRARKPRSIVVDWAVTSLHAELARASVAVVGGGVSLYEACAHGVAAVGVPVVAAQRPTVVGVRQTWGRAGRHPWTRLSGIGCGRMCRTADGRGHAPPHGATGTAADRRARRVSRRGSRVHGWPGRGGVTIDGGQSSSISTTRSIRACASCTADSAPWRAPSLDASSCRRRRLSGGCRVAHDQGHRGARAAGTCARRSG